MVAAQVQNARRRTIATLAGALGVLLWASEITLVTFAGDVPPLQMIALAFGAIGLLSPVVWRATGISAVAALRQPIGAWLLTVASLLAFHTCRYYAVQNAPPAGAALLQAFTPLLIVVGSALLPGERLRWWHVAGTLAGLLGTMFLVAEGARDPASDWSAAVPLAAAGVAAASWAIYSVVNRRYAEVPSAAMGGFYAASAVLAALGHLLFETWVTPSPAGWIAILALGLFPMGLSLYLWDYGVKNGDLQALGAFSYSEPLLAALIVILLGGDDPSWSLLWAGVLVVGGAFLAARNLWDPALQAETARGPGATSAGTVSPSAQNPDAILRDFQSTVAKHLSDLETAFLTALGAAHPDAAWPAAMMREHWPVLFAPEVRDSDRWRLERLATSYPDLVLNEEPLRRSYRAILDCLLQLALNAIGGDAEGLRCSSRSSANVWAKISPSSELDVLSGAG